MRYTLLILVFSVLLVSACQKNASLHTDASEGKHFPIKGKVISIDKAAKTASIDHEAIAGYMDAMTMNFPIKDDWVWDELKPGAEIRAELVVTKDGFWLEKLGIVAAPDANQPNIPIDENFAQIGKEVPAFSLVNQDGRRITQNDFRGKALAITFIYRECPLPDYCIKMSRIFSDLANQLRTSEQDKQKIRLLSISFDPQRDTPEKLKQYGAGYLATQKPDFTIWQLAVGSETDIRRIANFFGLRYEVDANDKTQINHSLRTIIVAPDGKVTKIFPGNDWTQADLLKELKATLSE